MQARTACNAFRSKLPAETPGSRCACVVSPLRCLLMLPPLRLLLLLLVLPLLLLLLLLLRSSAAHRARTCPSTDLPSRSRPGWCAAACGSAWPPSFGGSLVDSTTLHALGCERFLGGSQNLAHVRSRQTPLAMPPYRTSLKNSYGGTFGQYPHWPMRAERARLLRSGQAHRLWQPTRRCGPRLHKRRAAAHCRPHSVKTLP